MAENFGEMELARAAAAKNKIESVLKRETAEEAIKKLERVIELLIDKGVIAEEELDVHSDPDRHTN